MAQNGHAHIHLRILVARPLGQAHGATGNGALGNKDDRRILALAEPSVNQFFQLVNLGGYFGNDSRLGTRGDGAVQGEESRFASHDLDEEQARVTACGVADAVHTPHDGVQCRVIADGVVGTGQIVVDGARKAHDGEVKLAGKLAGAAQRAVAADHHQRVNAVFLDNLIGLLTSFNSPELLATRGLEDSAAVVHDAGNILGLQVNDLIFYQAPVATVDALNLKTVINRGTRHRADCRVHAGGVTSRSQYANSLDCCHNLFSFNDVLGAKVAFFLK